MNREELMKMYNNRSKKTLGQSRIMLMLLIDNSGSVRGKERAIINSIKLCLETISADPETSRTADISILVFNGREIRKYPFCHVDEISDLQMEASGSTPLGEALLEMLDMKKEREDFYHTNGILPKQKPLVVLLTDGEGNGEKTAMATAKKRLQNELDEGSLFLLPLTVGDKAERYIKELNSELRPIRMEALKEESLKKFFRSVSQSMARGSRRRMDNTFWEKEIESLDQILGGIK